jgi:hypothetical protein
MSRTRLAGTALLFLALLPGCGTLTGDRRTLCERWQDFWGTDRYGACPTGYPVVMDGPPGGCAMPIPGAAPYQGAPIIMGGPGAPLPGSDTGPPPNIRPQQIPPGGERPGKQKDIEELGSRTGPVGPALPTSGMK